jgi:hypothetical protein
MEAAVVAGDESEDVVVARPGVEEDHEAADPVTDPQWRAWTSRTCS